MPLFKKKSPEEVLKQNQRALNRTIRLARVVNAYVGDNCRYGHRELDRERSKLEQQEKKIIGDIKKMAKTGQMVRWLHIVDGKVDILQCHVSINLTRDSTPEKG